MWYWCCAPLMGLWWIFPLMFIAFMVMMFFVVRALFMGRFPCTMRPGYWGHGEARGNRGGRCCDSTHTGESRKES